MTPKTLLTVNYLQDGVCQVEANLQDDRDAKRLGASLFQAAQKDPLMQQAILFAVQTLILSPDVKDIITQTAEREAVRKMSKKQKN